MSTRPLSVLPQWGLGKLEGFELAAGFLFTEGLIAPQDIVKVSYCDALDVTQEFNVVTVRLNKPFDSHGLERNFYAASSCGLCGKASLDHVALRCPAIQHLRPSRTHRHKLLRGVR